MNHSGDCFNGQDFVIIETCDIKSVPIPETSTSFVKLNLATSSAEKAVKDVVYPKSISAEKAKQIKEEVLAMQKKRFKMTSPRKRKSASEKHETHSGLKNKASPKKYKAFTNCSSPKKLPDDKMPHLNLNKETVIFCMSAPGSERMELQSDKQTNDEDRRDKINVETPSIRETVVKTCESSSVKHVNKDSIATNDETSSVSKNIIFVDLADDDDDDDDVGDGDKSQKAQKKPSILQEKVCKISNRLSLNKEIQKEGPQKVNNLNVKTSKCLSGSAINKEPLNLSVKNHELKDSIPYEKGHLIQSSNNSGNVLQETSQKAEIFSVSEKRLECASKPHCNKLYEASSKENLSNLDTCNKSAGCSNYNNGTTVTSPILTSQTTLKTKETKQQNLQIEGALPENLLNETIKLSQSISQKPNKYAVKSTSSKNGLELVMAAGGSGKKRSPRNRLGKNSPVKAFRSPFSKKLKTLQGNKQKVRKSLNFEESEPEALASSSLFYTENYVHYFVKIILEVLDNELNKNLFRDELQTVQAFMGLEEEGKRLYVRMLGRKFKWHREADIHYDEIKSIRETLVKLETAGFITSDFSSEKLEVMLNLLRKQELQELCKTFRIKSSGNKPGLIQSLTEYGKNQTSVGMQSTATVLWREGLGHLGRCIRLCANHREVIQRLLTLFSVTHQDNAADRELSRLLSLKHFVETNRIVYPSYNILRTRPVFASRDDMLGHEAAEKLLNDLQTSIDCKDWEVVCSHGREAQKCLRELLQDTEKSEMMKQLPLFLRRFSAGSVYAYAVTQAVEGFRKSKATIQDAVIALRELLSQDIYLPHYRGRWYETLALLLHSHLHKGKEAAELIIEALNDDAVNEEFQHSLSIRGSRLLKVLKGNCADLKMKLSDVLKQPLDDIPEVTIKAKALGSNLPGYKKVYIEEDTGETTFSSVEELVISRYKKDFPEAIHGEGSTVSTLFALLFWDIIYHKDVPDVFQSPYQIEPLDLLSGEFYVSRKEAIDQRLRDLNEWNSEQLQWMVKEIYRQHEGKTSLVNWNRFRGVNQVMNVIKCIGVRVLSRILERFAKHYRHVRKGFPDLILWAPARSECLFVEVKGPKDRLSVCQKIWLNKLIEFGARAEVCHVQTTGSKALKRKSSAASSEDNHGTLNNKEIENGSECIELSE